MRNVSQLFKDAIKSPGREIGIKITIGDKIYKDVSNLNYYTENEIFKSSMGCLTLSLKDITDIESNIIDCVEIGVKVTALIDSQGDTSEYYEYADYGSFYITEKEFNVETNELEITAYDFMYFTMKSYTGINEGSSDEVTLIDIVQMVCFECGLECENIEFPNSDIVIMRSWLNDCSTYRDILDAVAGIACVNFRCISSEMIAVDYSQTDVNISPSEMKTLKIGEHIGNYDVIDFAGVISTVRLPDSSVESDNTLKIENNPIIFGFVDTENTSNLTRIYNRLISIDFYTYETSTIGFVYLEPGDKAFITDMNGTRYPVIIMNVNLTVNQGVTETFAFEKPSIVTDEASGTENINAFAVKDHIMQKTFTRADGQTATIKFGYVSGSSNANYIQMIDMGDSEYPYAVTDEGVIECEQVISRGMPVILNPIMLWSGVSQLTGSDMIDFSYNGGKYDGEPASILDMPNGIVLVFSRYSNGVEDNSFSFHFVHKNQAIVHNAKGINVFLCTAKFLAIANKYFYLTPYGIRGNDSNTESGTSNGITYNNNGFVLRYIYGV